MANAREIKSRIASVNGTKKVTRAMEMVAAAKMRAAVAAVMRTRSYANASWEVVLNLAQSINAGTTPHPLLAKRKEVRNVGIILVASNRGLCGGFNASIINKTVRSIKKYQESGGSAIGTEIVLWGNKGVSIHKNHGYAIAADFSKSDIVPTWDEAGPVAAFAIERFLAGAYDKVMVAYTNFASATRHIPHVKQLLPIDIDPEGAYLGIFGSDTHISVEKKALEDDNRARLTRNNFRYKYLFEPNAEDVLDTVIPKLVQTQLYQALLESNASEHGARTAAMHQATEAAGDMARDLTLSYHKARQAAITAEIAEVSAGAEALSV